MSDLVIERIPVDGWNDQAYHVTRYAFAAERCRGRLVLDAACGVGYGAALLAGRGARRVLGLDIDRGALAAAAEHFGSAGSAFARADLVAIPLADRSVEVVVSFETIEHVADARACLGELRRVLRDDGALIISTPNALITRPVAGRPRNPYHVREFTPAEFRALLAPHFRQIELFGQHRRASIAAPQAPRQLRERNAWLNAIPAAPKRLIAASLPSQIWNPLFFLLRGHHPQATAADIVFSQGAIEHAPVLIAVCRHD